MIFLWFLVVFVLELRTILFLFLLLFVSFCCVHLYFMFTAVSYHMFFHERVERVVRAQHRSGWRVLEVSEGKNEKSERESRRTDDTTKRQGGSVTEYRTERVADLRKMRSAAESAEFL